MKFKPVTNQEVGWQGYTHRLEISYRDIPTGLANNTAQVWNAAPLPAIPNHTIIYDAYLILVTPFANSGDTALNSDTFSVGDAGSATRYFSAVELNLNGTYVSDSFAATKNVQYTAADQLKVTLNSMSGKSLSNLNQGLVIVQFRIGNADRQRIIDNTQP